MGLNFFSTQHSLNPSCMTRQFSCANIQLLAKFTWSFITKYFRSKSGKNDCHVHSWELPILAKRFECCFFRASLVSKLLDIRCYHRKKPSLEMYGWNQEKAKMQVCCKHHQYRRSKFCRHTPGKNVELGIESQTWYWMQLLESSIYLQSTLCFCLLLPPRVVG